MKNYKIGDFVEGKVTGIEKYGIFLSIGEEDVTGLIHISEISDDFVRNVFDYAKVDEIIRAKVIDLDRQHHKLKLTIKNIEYRDKSKWFSKIKENGNGFLELEKTLPEWILEKEKEIDKSKKNCK